MSGPGGIEVHQSDLQQISGVLDGAGSTLFGHADDLDQAPDAGASSDEVATVLTSLSSAVAALAEHLGSLAESTRAVSSDFGGTDHAVGGAMDRRREVLGP